MEPERSLPHSQQLTTYSYPDPDQSCHAPLSYFLKIHLNIIIPSKSKSSKRSLSLRFPHQNPICTSPLPQCYMPRLSYSSWFYHRNNIWWAVQFFKLCNVYLSPLPCYSVPLRPIYFPQCSILLQHQPMFLPQCERPSFTPIQNNRQYYSSVYLYLHIFG